MIDPESGGYLAGASDVSKLKMIGESYTFGKKILIKQRFHSDIAVNRGFTVQRFVSILLTIVRQSATSRRGKYDPVGIDPEDRG